MVTVTKDGPIARIRVDDSSHRNRLTPQVLAQLPEALRSAAADPGVRVIVLAGRADVFCLGARHEDLLAMRAGEITALYADECVRAPIRCPLPVVGEMQGHAIGGGLILGLFCDIAVLSERSIYNANFLQHGFAPCMGTSVLLTHRMGSLLGTEMLLTGGRYQGRELRARSAPVRVVPHGQVESECMRLARELARVPRRTLELMKTRLARPLLDATDQALFPELRMLEETMRLPEVGRRLLGGEESGGTPPVPPQ